MAETEVESILREIRERVISRQHDKESIAVSSAMTNGSNGACDAEALQHDNETLLANLSLIESYLTTTARAWDRLPPLVSNRTGLIARVELWLKRQLKRATRWFTWEQVNFNASVHHALRDLLPILSAQANELRRQKGAAEAERGQQQTELADLRSDIDAQDRAAKTQGDRMAALSAQFGQLVNEVREGNRRLQDEQRVCFKQVALETSEAAVLEDRARRKTENLLEELQRRVDWLEKKRQA